MCNLNCKFCPKTERTRKFMSLDEFEFLTNRLKDHVRFLYFHLMGEPFLHPQLSEFISIARHKGFIPILTTNGTLLNGAHSVIDALPYKIQISLHSHEGNDRRELDKYVRDVMLFAQEASSKGVIVVLRLWNQGGYDRNNDRVIQLMEYFQPQPWTERSDGWKLTDNLYLEYDRMFEWPDSQQDEFPESEMFCYALRNQIGVLVDGSVVPCCLDHEGDITLGNLFHQSLDEVLISTRAKRLYDGFSNHLAVESLCRKCGYAAVTKQFRK